MNFRIKIFGILNGIKVNTLVGVSGLINLFGESEADEFIVKAFNGTTDRCIVKPRRSSDRDLKITFYVK